MAFTDGAVNESAYRSKLKRLKKEESDLLKCRRGIDLTKLGEMISLGIHIDMVKEVLSRGSLLVTDSGIFGELGGMYSPVDFNALEKRDDKLTEVEIPDKGTFRFEMTDMVIGDMDSTHALCSFEDTPGKRELIERNQRATFQFFNIGVIVYPERVEIKGMIPTQILDMINKEGKGTAPIITSAPLAREG